MVTVAPKKPARKRAERETPEQRRTLILLAVRTCFSERGMRGFTLKNVAEEAKVSISCCRTILAALKSFSSQCLDQRSSSEAG
jgi:DNA-binding transcriptional regulator YbjK